LVDRDPVPPVALEAGRALVRVPDALAGLQQVAESIRRDRDDLTVIAVTGSTGKTSTKDLLAAALAPLGVFANAESYNNEFGLPLTLCNAPAAAAVVVTEMGERFAAIWIGCAKSPSRRLAWSPTSGSRTRNTSGATTVRSPS
jgi:UDP-N-acetylmuramyl pentapeptide synthase